VRFVFDGSGYELNLSKKNAAAFHKQLVGHGALGDRRTAAVPPSLLPMIPVSRLAACV
jgi:hypothetical protein